MHERPAWVLCGQPELCGGSLGSVGAAWTLQGQPGLCGATLSFEQTATITQRTHRWPPTLAVFQQTPSRLLLSLYTLRSQRRGCQIECPQSLLSCLISTDVLGNFRRSNVVNLNQHGAISNLPAKKRLLEASLHALYDKQCD